jgi:acyl-CoA thioesterase-1
VVEPRSIVIAEIGGNDLLGSTTPEAFERDLDALLARMGSDGRTVLLLELPLPPGYNRFGQIQRGLAARHGALLVPKRVLMGVLASGGATLDSIHLSQAGHARMAETIWRIVWPAFRALPADR